MTAAQVLMVIGAIAVPLASYGAARLAGKSSVDVATISADEGAFMRAEKIYQGAIGRLETENGQLRADLEEQSAEIRALKARVAELEGGGRLIRV